MQKLLLMLIVTSRPSAFEADLKNPEVSPSGPGALLELSLNIVFCISSSVGIVTIANAFSSGQRKSEIVWNHWGEVAEVS